MPDGLLFARTFLKNPKMLGSVWPSSDYLCSRLLRPVDWTSVRTVVEYGPGVGTITRHILRRMQRNATLVAIEKNPELVSYLRAQFASEGNRLRLVHDSAANVCEILSRIGETQADCIVSGIPFSLLPQHEVQRIIAATRRCLGPEGKFLVYQFSDAIRPVLEGNFSSVNSSVELRNFLPARTYVAGNP